MAREHRDSGPDVRGHGGWIDLQLPPPPSALIDDVSMFIGALAAALGNVSFDVFVPPGDSNDVAGAGAYDLAMIGSW